MDYVRWRRRRCETLNRKTRWQAGSEVFVIYERPMTTTENSLWTVCQLTPFLSPPAASSWRRTAVLITAVLISSHTQTQIATDTFRQLEPANDRQGPAMSYTSSHTPATSATTWELRRVVKSTVRQLAPSTVRCHDTTIRHSRTVSKHHGAFRPVVQILIVVFT